MTTSRTVPGQIVMRALSTNRVLKLIRFNAPMLRDDASVNSRLCSNITLCETQITVLDLLISYISFREKNSVQLNTKTEASERSQIERKGM